MKRYAHLELTGSYVSITTTDSKTAETIIAQVERFVGGQIEVTHKEFWYELKKLRNRDTAVHDWLIGWLCSNGWEPYAVWGEVIGGGEIRNHTTPHYCFRKEID